MWKDYIGLCLGRSQSRVETKSNRRKFTDYEQRRVFLTEKKKKQRKAKEYNYNHRKKIICKMTIVKCPELDFSIGQSWVISAVPDTFQVSLVSAFKLLSQEFGSIPGRIRQLLAKYVIYFSFLLLFFSLFTVKNLWWIRGYEANCCNKSHQQPSVWMTLALGERHSVRHLSLILLGRKLGDCCLGFLFEPKVSLALWWTQKEPKTVIANIYQSFIKSQPCFNCFTKHRPTEQTSPHLVSTHLWKMPPNESTSI